MKQFNVDGDQKCYFPYSSLQNASDLMQISMPAYESFYSSLAQCNTLEEDYSAYKRLLELDHTESEALKLLQVVKPPLTGHEQYQHLVEI